jgi:hypothetical protein
VPGREPYGDDWFAARLRNHVDVCGYRQIGVTPAWTVLRDTRATETIACSHDGRSISLGVAAGRTRRVDGGIAYIVVEDEHNVELADRGDWSSTFVSARAEYGVFVLAELEPFVAGLSSR